MNFQQRVTEWVKICFGESNQACLKERTFRFAEEAIELCQALDMTKEEFIILLDYTYNKPPGTLGSEVGGTMITLAALCETAGIDMVEAGDNELNRNFTRMEEIRNNNLNKKSRMNV